MTGTEDTTSTIAKAATSKMNSSPTSMQSDSSTSDRPLACLDVAPEATGQPSFLWKMLYAIASGSGNLADQ